jgi:hypothetical protein
MEALALERENRGRFRSKRTAVELWRIEKSMEKRTKT